MAIGYVPCSDTGAPVTHRNAPHTGKIRGVTCPSTGVH